MQVSSSPLSTHTGLVSVFNWMSVETWGTIMLHQLQLDGSRVNSKVMHRVRIVKAGKPGEEVQMDRSGGAVTLLGDNDL